MFAKNNTTTVDIFFGWLQEVGISFTEKWYFGLASLEIMLFSTQIWLIHQTYGQAKSM